MTQQEAEAIFFVCAALCIAFYLLPPALKEKRENRLRIHAIEKEYDFGKLFREIEDNKKTRFIEDIRKHIDAVNEESAGRAAPPPDFPQPQNSK